MIGAPVIRSGCQNRKARLLKMDSSSCSSKLVELFVARSSTPHAGAESVMLSYVGTLQQKLGKRRRRVPIEQCLAPRNVRAVTCTANNLLDGFIEPIGSKYSDGFRVHLNASSPQPRRKFTLAHEICHTFFYEAVPEVKFLQHDVDPLEERLCNVGAAELLIPETHVRRFAQQFPVGLKALESIALEYGVSMECALIRLVTLKLWNAQLSVWKRSATEDDACISRYGLHRNRDWSWKESRVLRDAWAVSECDYKYGRTFIEHLDGESRWVLPVYYESQRRGDFLTVLWVTSRNKTKSAARQSTLF